MKLVKSLSTLTYEDQSHFGYSHYTAVHNAEGGLIETYKVLAPFCLECLGTYL